MKPLSIMKKTILAAALALVGSLSCQAQVTTDPVGFVSITVLAKSDASLGVPLARPNEFQGVVQSISGNVITLAGTPGWTASQFVYVAGTQPKTYFARIDSGANEGLIATITANDTSSVTVTVPTGDSLSGILTNAANGTGDTISIAPYWTLGTLIPGAAAGTQVLLYSTTQAGINLSASAIYFSNGTDWYQNATLSDDVILVASQGFTLRNNTVNPITFSITGSVPMATNRLVVGTLAASKQQDQRIFFNSPVPEYVGNTGLGTSPGDQLLIFNNSLSGENQSANVILVWTGSKWNNGGTDVTNTYQLQPGSSYVLRKAPSASPSTVVTSHLQSYLQ